MSLEKKKEQIIEDLTEIQDPQERVLYLIDIAKSHPSLSPEYKVETFRVTGCQSLLWLFPEERDGRCYFTVDSDSMVVKGIAALLAELYSGEKAEDIISLDPEFLAELGITQHLTYNRRNALSRIYGMIKAYAQGGLGSDEDSQESIHD